MKPSENSVLLIDPFENVLTIYRMILEEEGYHVDIETDLSTSFESFLAKRHPIVIMEYTNSFEDTVSFIESIKKAAPETYLLINTSKVIEDPHFTQLSERGLDEYLLKPYAPEKLLVLLRKGLKQREIILEKQAQDQQSFFEPLARKVNQEIVSQSYFIREIRRELKKAKRHQIPMSLLLLKIPNKELVGDQYESFYGTLVTIVKNSLREEDYVGRENGKLGIILSQTDQAGSQMLGQRLSDKIQSCPSFQSDLSLKPIIRDLSFQSYTFSGQSEMPEVLNRLYEGAKTKPPTR
jgi:DNA-binding response OmpR family regulator